MTERSAAGTKDLAWLWQAQREKPLTRKRIKKLAAQLSDAAVAASLGLELDQANDPHLYLIEDAGGVYTQCFMPGDQVMHWMDDTPEPLRVAQTEFLRRRGYPVFGSQTEAEAHAAAKSWPAAQPGKSGSG